ncbi:MAG TPA: hypothetical protein VFT71_05010 [Candidatus Nitrosocosmicus sp.]|nr:hypothetical protein [Candidatus Nitrosocosmicus sp.]
MKKTQFSHNRGTGISVLLIISMIVFSLVLASTFVDTYGSSLSNSTSSLSNSTSPTANLTAEPESRNGTIASFPGSVDSDRRHMPV